MLHVTFNYARLYKACRHSYHYMANYLGGDEVYGLNTPITLSLVCSVCGVFDAIWALRCVVPEERPERDRISRLLACTYAERVLPIIETAYPGDTRALECINAARRYALGCATNEELFLFYCAASDAAMSYKDPAAEAAWAAASTAISAPSASVRAANASYRSALSAFNATPPAEGSRNAFATNEQRWQTEQFLIAIGASP